MLQCLLFSVSLLFASRILHDVQCCCALPENTADGFFYSFTVFTRKTGEYENSSVCFEKHRTNKKSSTRLKEFFIYIYSVCIFSYGKKCKTHFLQLHAAVYSYDYCMLCTTGQVVLLNRVAV